MHALQTALAAIVTALALANTAAATPSCADVSDALTVGLVAAHPTTTEELTATREEMDAIAVQIGATSEMRNAHPLLLIVAQAGTHVEIAHRVIERQDAQGVAYVCDVPRSVDVIIGAFKRRVILHREAAADGCIRQALLDHMAQHSRVLDAHIDLFVDEHRDELAREIQALTHRAAADEATATHAFETGVAALVGSLYRQFEAEVEQSRLEADTPQALEQLGQACGERLRRLERKTRAGGQRASLPDHGVL